MPKRQSGLINSNIAVSSKFNEVEYGKITSVYNNLDDIASLLKVFDTTYYGPLAADPVNGEINPITGNAYELTAGVLYYNTTVQLLKVYDGTEWDATSLKDYVDSEVLKLQKGKTDVIYGHGLPADNLNPVNGTNAMYVDLDTDTSWVCTNATTDKNRWIPSSGGQLLGNARDKAIMWTSQTTSENLILPTNQNGLIVDSLIIEGDGSLEIQGNAVLVTI